MWHSLGHFQDLYVAQPWSLPGPVCGTALVTSRIDLTDCTSSMDLVQVTLADMMLY